MVDSCIPEVFLRDGPYEGSRFTIARLEDTILIADAPLDDASKLIDPQDPPVPVAVYELAVEFRGPDGDAEGIDVYAGHRYPRHR